MTYCVGTLLDAGLVMASDSRTNAGVDSIASFRKQTVFEVRGHHVICLLSAGNLALTQSAVSLLEEWTHSADEAINLTLAPTLFRVARIVGLALREIHRQDAEHLRKFNTDFNASFLLGGQIQGERPRLFQIYNAGNFIEAGAETPFFQIGETKYGKPVIDRLLQAGMSLAEAAKLLLISFDSTLRSNLSVGLPIDLLCYEKDSLAVTHNQSLGEGHPYLVDIHRQWGDGLRRVFQEIPPPVLEG